MQWHEDFFLFFFSRSSNPSLSPNIFSRVVVINFSATAHALEEQLLTEVVKLEMEDLEKERDNLIVSMAEDKKQKTALEEKILTVSQTGKRQRREKDSSQKDDHTGAAWTLLCISECMYTSVDVQIHAESHVYTEA